MTTDRYGLTVTAASPAALEGYDRGAEGLLAWDAGALPSFQAAVAHDPGLAVAHAGAGVCLFLDERFAEAREAMATAERTATSQSERERSHVRAMALLVTGHTAEAERAMLRHLDVWPRDLPVLQRLYFIWFWQGRFPEMLHLTTALARHHPGSSYMLGLHAFALEQAGRCDDAVRMAQAAVAANPRDAWAVHALAHALYEMAAFDTGLRRLPDCVLGCANVNWFRRHLVWHITLMRLGVGDYEGASATSREVFERVSAPVAGELHDSISLLWRLALTGRDVRERWRPFVAIARERLGRPGLLYHAVHLGMALAAAGDAETAAAQLTMLRERAPKDPTGLTGDVAVPLLEGLHAFAAADYRRAVERIEPLRGRIVELGGSRAQRDVYHDTLLEACFRAGDVARAERLLAERLARRPEHFWRTRRRAAA